MAKLNVLTDETFEQFVELRKKQIKVVGLISPQVSKLSNQVKQVFVMHARNCLQTDIIKVCSDGKLAFATDNYSQIESYISLLENAIANEGYGVSVEYRRFFESSDIDEELDRIDLKLVA